MLHIDKYFHQWTGLRLVAGVHQEDRWWRYSVLVIERERLEVEHLLRNPIRLLRMKLEGV